MQRIEMAFLQVVMRVALAAAAGMIAAVGLCAVTEAACSGAQSSADHPLGGSPRWHQGTAAAGGGQGRSEAEAGNRRQPRKHRSSDGLQGRCAVCMESEATMGFLHNHKVHLCVCRGCYRELCLRGKARRCLICGLEATCTEVIST
ncbi:hypothetical protein VOLCADRAFT_99133 [Volvox carteri f. nagariensis]|uniref:FSI1f n=1 Tax=Volvox carteri f. nagariensis TaxID=3068 RepID=D8UH28_VOLCA|nr:uncharacterized protein VOLCADRAFT_99133 [Volvox carteri f. nagariensis]ADI46884.1 FSI1f [Volvox carteri f. nagariensis]EFJ41000.1 hypothetical protein VOLCADRAFT_99133 [Volvox carteri f. nagariensis]|eukprot:XP_002957974.1 hypothetical protein VOLCADRAFT_99133 [Volvox carteri f. nagariensis]